MSTPNRIVLTDAQGAELFSGGSLLSEPPTLRRPTLRREETARAAPPDAHLEREAEDEARREEEDEPIPETLRSSVLVRVREPVSRPIVIEEDHRAA
ncbi:MAG: hypothetical protein KF850_15550 [Labilithrix sp.]|nr:hypothetical protein [Labilithrix sp.]